MRRAALIEWACNVRHVAMDQRSSHERALDRDGAGRHGDVDERCDVDEQAHSVERESSAQSERTDARERARARLDALASLLSDESAHTYEEVKRALLRAGRAARPALLRAERGDAPLARTRARALLTTLERKNALRRLLRYALRGRVDLERALFLLARYHDPHLDVRPFHAELDRLAHEVGARARLRTDPLQRALVLVEYLGVELGFGGTRGQFHQLENIQIHKSIENKSGMPLTLCAIYCAVARRAGLRAACLPLPGHVMLRLYGDQSSVIVDPYNKGAQRSERDCLKYLERNGLSVQPSWFRDADDAVLLRRQVANLVRSAQICGRTSEAKELAKLLRALEPRVLEKTAN